MEGAPETTRRALWFILKAGGAEREARGEDDRLRDNAPVK